MALYSDKEVMAMIKSGLNINDVTANESYQLNQLEN